MLLLNVDTTFGTVQGLLPAATSDLAHKRRVLGATSYFPRHHGLIYYSVYGVAILRLTRYHNQLGWRVIYCMKIHRSAPRRNPHIWFDEASYINTRVNLHGEQQGSVAPADGERAANSALRTPFDDNPKRKTGGS